MSWRRTRWVLAILAVVVEVGAFVAWRLALRRDRAIEIRPPPPGE